MDGMFGGNKYSDVQKTCAFKKTEINKSVATKSVCLKRNRIQLFFEISLKRLNRRINEIQLFNDLVNTVQISSSPVGRIKNSNGLHTAPGQQFPQAWSQLCSRSQEVTAEAGQVRGGGRQLHTNPGVKDQFYGDQNNVQDYECGQLAVVQTQTQKNQLVLCPLDSNDGN